MEDDVKALTRRIAGAVADGLGRGTEVRVPDVGGPTHASTGQATSRAGFGRRWVVRVTAGEVLGFTAPAAVGAALATAPAAVEVPALVAAGLVEGALLGSAQASVLRRALPALRTGQFVLATALAAATAYAIAMLPVMLGDRLSALPVVVLAAGGAVLGAVLLASIGTAQWLVLRPVAPRSVFWIPATAAAWVVALGAFLAVSTPLWQPGQPFALTAAIGVLAGLVMAVTVAVVTLPAALRLTRGGTWSDETIGA
ncbi:hypothetical protein ACQEVB_24495 [Pseudonocardia sp. CA-107938]|uniref:hypothetical protein n=1 Tax=Pseudonocardia sp. CA-107938 TaxID=3240021 RepID=UPI003D8B9F34